MKRINQNIICLLIVTLLVMSSISIQAGDPDRIGSAAGTQLQIPVGSRDIAMSGANISLTKGVEAIYWNPAGLSSADRDMNGMFSTNTIFNSITVNYFAFSAAAGEIGSFGFDVKSLDFGDIPLTTRQDHDGSSGATFSPTFTTIGLTYSKKLSTSTGIGIRVKMISESFPGADASAFAVDAGLQYNGLVGLEGFSFGAVMRNIGTDLKYDGSALTQRVQDPQTGKVDFFKQEASSDQLPASLDLGLAYSRSLDETSSMIITGVFAHQNTELDGFKFGAEYNYDDFIAVRGGYNALMGAEEDYEQLYDFTLGAGIQYEVGGMMLNVDYAYRHTKDFFDASNVFSLRVGF